MFKFEIQNFFTSDFEYIFKFKVSKIRLPVIIKECMFILQNTKKYSYTYTINHDSMLYDT